MIKDHSKCQFSTGICGTLTAGQGKLDDNGYWELPCPECVAKFELPLQKLEPVVKESSLTISNSLGLRAVNFVSMMKLNLEWRQSNNTIKDEEVLLLMECNAILDQVKSENNLTD